MTRKTPGGHARRQRSNRRHPDLFELAPVAIGLFDDAGHVLDANRALCDLLGYRHQDICGLGAMDLLHPQERAERIALDAADPGSCSGTPLHRQRMLARSDGQPVFCDVCSSVSTEEDGSRVWVAVLQDVTKWNPPPGTQPRESLHDELTGMPNRRGITKLLGRLLDDGATDRLAVLVCNIDQFKRVNDSLGHEAGDELLVVLAQRLRSELPDQCTVARVSGDEYLIVCSDIDAVGGLEALTLRLSKSLRTTVPVGGELIGVSACIGATAFDNAVRTPEDLLRSAHTALSEAKTRGPGRVSLAHPDLVTLVTGKMHLEGQLREAIANNDMTLRYQPIVDREGSVVMAEALVRWPHPVRGLLSPDVILPVAEQGDQLRELDLWVLRTALHEAANWPMSGGRPVGIGVNLSSFLPGDPAFVEEVSRIVDECGIGWDRVVLEMVETSLVDLSPQAQQSMSELIERGVRFAIDDFGTGYSSLARLKDLPAQIIKLDRRFVAGVDHDAADFAIARAVRNIARAMGRACVAEGVETTGQLRLLKFLELDTYQGFLFSAPLPAQEFRELVDSPLPMG
ncbi:PAS domain S-box-containing protein/diguanylate cyclase (GGDEF)-like protein [Halopolyspora algeriensis]|uniref:PAS domain S-box-containing protein/diguanylate cyclase (GGDEF)-like protein n=1 Tax=Halopolyspora algeriensis TaxID=1500506 RepID=A0A368VHD5_9ACTN|nr:bifunctional diguanylate cyclase/phosphodiesterase [Halopolyspora algeriensis]RCW40771.1 PAS domain S-box-containing protein/diguanylate cyclase (GGDEF)-like protein [Halopolyspora algeriensis]TQM53310.1 PAS domain S-box-containing protein/diguanylate cyclase (GGDEF)-like protein [Halopolyspora algeriensis]